MSAPLTSDLNRPEAIPYFLWDEPMSVACFRERLAQASLPERDRLLGKLLREARERDIWLFTTPEEIAARLPSVSKHLGRRRAFWEFLLAGWRRLGILHAEPA